MLQNPVDGENSQAYLLHGDLPLDLVWHQSEWLQHGHTPVIAGFDNVGFIRLTADGLSFAADGKLPWVTNRLRARYLLTCPFDFLGNGFQAYSVTLDRRDPAQDRFTAPSTTIQSFVDGFQELRSILTRPNEDSRPVWQELELSSDFIPPFHWHLANGAAEFRLDAGTLELRIADGPPPKDPESLKERRVSSMQPEWRVRAAAGFLDLAVVSSTPPGTLPRATWTWTGPDTDRLTLDHIATSDDPLATAGWTRQVLGLPRPIPLSTSDGPERPPLLYAFSPLLDGWTHWPVPNLIPEDYEPPASTGNKSSAVSEPPGLMSGVITYRNHPSPDTDPARGGHQNPWTITVRQGKMLGSTSAWRFAMAAPGQVVSAITCVLDPVLELDGLLWLSVRRATIEDALPDPVDHLSHLRAISVRSVDPMDEFPNPFCIRWDAIHVDFVPMGDPQLAGWQMRLGMNPDFPNKGKEWLDAFRHSPLKGPLLFRRHPSLPFIQSLPLLQSQDPPSHPAASRELAILTQPWEEKYHSYGGWIHEEWVFRSRQNGWPEARAVPAFAAEWVKSGLPLASLTLPGLTLDPRDLTRPLYPEKDPDENPEQEYGHGPYHLDLPRGAFNLVAQYWYGLPYLDQLHALSQMPPDEEGDEADMTTVHVTGVLRRERRPLDRESLGDWWEDLRSRQLLARTETAECLKPGSDPTFKIGALVEPFPWLVTVTLDETYPGTLDLAQPGTPLVLRFQREDALHGFRGSFRLDGGNNLQLDSLSLIRGAEFQIVAGSMIISQDDEAYLRDQRGLYRLGSTVTTVTINGSTTDLYVDTPLKYLGVNYTQRTLLQPLKLTGADDEWAFLMAGVALNDATHTFDRAESLSGSAEDANDPGARGVEHNFRAGYTWWLGTEDAKPLKLCSLEVFPLALESLHFPDTNTIKLRVLARLQLPVVVKVGDPKARPLEQTQRSNTVFLDFEGSLAAGLVLQHVTVAPPPGESNNVPGEWQLNADESGPIITWQTVTFDLNAHALTFGAPRLLFSLFGQNREIDLDPLVIARNAPTTVHATIEKTGPGVTVESVSGTLQPLGNHQVELRLAFIWGERLRLQVLQSCPLLGSVQLPSQASFLSDGGTLPLRCDTQMTLGLGFQAVLSFDGEVAPGLQLLPGMALANADVLKNRVTGFAAISYSASRPVAFLGHLIPTLDIAAAAAELIVPARWGQSLQDAALNDNAPAQQVFGSSAGDLFANFTAEWIGDGWQCAFLLNGWMEVKNLISWPTSIVSSPAAGGLVGPQEYTLLFEEGSISLPAGFEATFQEVAAVLAQNRAVLRVEGHASDTGDDPGNLALSLQRAQAVRQRFIQYLRDHFQQPLETHLIGLVEPAVAFGEHRLRVLAYDDQARAANRRVVLILRPLSVRIPITTDPLDHDRHTIRVLFNQQMIPSPVLDGAGAGDNTLATVIANGSWSFIAVVQHELTRIRQVTNDGARPEERRRWTIAQEVRLVPAKRLADSLVTLAAESVDDAISGVRKTIGKVFQWTLGSTWLQTGGGAAAIRLLAPALLVEASVPFWIRTGLDGEIPPSPAPSSVLQFLPDGTPRGSMTVPADFGSVHQGERPWLFVSMPFLGRLQPAANDTAAPSPLARDPVLTVLALRDTTAPAVLALACREATRPLWAFLRDFDDAKSRRFERLTEGSLEEGLYRYLHPTAERGETPGAFAPIMAALPTNSPGRSTRPAALAAVFDAKRRQFPPGETGDLTITVAPPPIVWGLDAWFGQQSGVRFNSTPPLPVDDPVWETPPQVFFVPAIVLRELWFTPQTTFIAATALPVATEQIVLNNQPATVAVSPCTALDFVRIPPAENITRLVTFGEVLAVTFDAQGQGALRTVLSTVWIEPGNTVAADARRWAREAVSELAAESAVVIIRLRSTVKIGNTESVATRFEHLMADAPALAPAEAPTSALRADYRRLHFANGQYAGENVPAVRRFELAPPLTDGVQPIWSTNLVSETGLVPSSLSALRFAIRTLQSNGPAVVGPADTGAAMEKDILWWQSVWHQVAFENGPPGRLLPEGFRAPARRGLLAAPAQLRAPEPATLSSFVTGGPWQPLLPAALNFLLAGARPGAPFLVRPLTITQRKPLAPAASQLVAGASVPVQHRYPRPVPLPDNIGTRLASAHQPWASFAFPTANHLDDPKTFPDLAAFDLAAAQFLLVHLEAVIQEAPAVDASTDPADAEVKHRGGLILAGCKTLAFELSMEDHAGVVTTTRPPGLTASITDGVNTTRLTLTYVTHPLKPAYWRAEPELADTRAALTAWVAKKAHGSVLYLEFSVEPQGTRVKGYRQNLRLPVQVCDPLKLRASMERRLVHFEDPAYNRALASTPAQKLGEILEAALVPPRLRPVMLAVDRREYNPTGLLIGVFADTTDPAEQLANQREAIATSIQVQQSATFSRDRGVLNETTGNQMTRVQGAPTANEYRVDVAAGTYHFNATDVSAGYTLRITYTHAQATSFQAYLQVCLISPESGLPEELNLPTDVTNPHQNNEIFSFSLTGLTRGANNLPVILTAGDMLLIRAWSGNPNGPNPGPLVEVAVQIVSHPVTPPPDHAYALLAAECDEGSLTISRAHCVRFAWCPFPDRIELLDPDDLLRNSVRRRAVFRWLDAVAPGPRRSVKHAIQKIAASGSTHWSLV
jgi:hypothetical protein